MGRWGAEPPRIAELDDVAVDCLAGALEVCARKIGAFQPNAKTPHIPGLVDALLHDRHDGRRVEQIGLYASRHSGVPRAVGRLAHGNQPHRTFFSDDIASVGDPGGRSQAAE